MKRTGFIRNRPISNWFVLCLRVFCVGRLVSSFVDELEEFRAVEVSGECVSNLLAIFGLSNHLLLADLVIWNVDMRARLQIVKLHKSLLGLAAMPRT
jgi:hypothetical protein